MVKARSRKTKIDSSTSVNISLNSSKSEKEKLTENGVGNIAAEDCKEHHYPTMHWWFEDRNSVLLLFFLYVLQGIPLGLAGSIPMLLAVSYCYFSMTSFY